MIGSERPGRFEPGLCASYKFARQRVNARQDSTKGSGLSFRAQLQNARLHENEKSIRKGLEVVLVLLAFPGFDGGGAGAGVLAGGVVGRSDGSIRIVGSLVGLRELRRLF